MFSGRLRRKAEMCDRLAHFMSDPCDRDRLLQSKKTFLAIAAEGDARPAAPSRQHEREPATVTPIRAPWRFRA